MYLAWAVVSGLESDFLRDEVAPDAVVHLRERKITPGDFLINASDEKFIDDEISEEAKRFTDAYYASNLYFEDYDETLGGDFENLYEIPDTWDTFDKLKPMIDRRFDEWKRGVLKVPNKPSDPGQ
jgi:hypothetical protein